MLPYDLLIKGGEAIIPATGFRGDVDIAIVRGEIAAIEPDIPANDASEVIAAQGLLVVPGLIDLHTHLGFEVHRRVIYAQDVCPCSGVTTAVDMGTTGVFTFPWYRDRILNKCPIRLFEFINISSIGTIAVHTPYFVEHYGDYIDIHDTARMIEENREYIRGLKVFASGKMVGDAAIEALLAARQVADEVALPIAVHVSARPPTLEEILSHLRRGDIITHTYTPHDQGILDEQGQVRVAVREARQRGVLFDLGHGSGSFGFEVARKALAQDFLPDSISTDIYYANVITPVKDLLTTASKFLNLGLPLEEALARVTCNPARMIGESSLGTLALGGPADVALLMLNKGDFSFVDCLGQTLEGQIKLDCQATICAGKIIYQKVKQ